ncbi:MAG: DUF6285 domain-containing protein [Actinomycetota bacterium]
MRDEPDAVTLLEAMATTLTEQVVPATSGGAQHSARVVANLCRILARDHGLDGDDDTRAALAALVGRQGNDPDLAAALDELIQRGESLDRLLPLLLADTARRAEIAKPGYTDASP